MVIDVLGIGVVDGAGGSWLLGRVCARMERGDEVIAVVARERLQRQAFLDTISGRCIPRKRAGPRSCATSR